MEFVGNVQLVAGTARDIDTVLRMLAKNGIETSANPDLTIEQYQNFGIDDARALRERAVMRASSSRRIFVLSMSGITAEAQNALLKTLEEPSGNALFILIHPAPQQLLPTLRSRAQTLAIESSSDVQLIVDPQVFIKAVPQKRLDMLKPLLEKGEDDKRDTGQILGFLSGIERELASAKDIDREGLDALYRARAYISDRGALVKPLLEQLALMLATGK